MIPMFYRTNIYYLDTNNCLTVLVCVQASRASCPSSRPNPLSLTPPKAVVSCSRPQKLTVTVPTSNAAETLCIRSESLEKTAAFSP